MEANKLTVKDSCLSFLLGFILCQLGVLVATCLVLFVCKFLHVNSSILNTCVGYTILSLSLYFVMVLVFAYFNKNKNNKITQKVKVSKLLIYISIAVAAFFALYPIVVCCDTLLTKLGFSLSTLSYELTTKNYFISILSLAIAPAICEELLFRGLIFSGLKKHGKILSISLTSVMFCLYHLSISQTVYPLLMGLLLTIIMFYEQNIYYCIAAHFTNNFLSLTLSYFKINLVFNHWSYILLAVILCVIFLSIVLTALIKGNKKHSIQPLNKNEKFIITASLVIMFIFWILANFI